MQYVFRRKERDKIKPRRCLHQTGLNSFRLRLALRANQPCSHWDKISGLMNERINRVTL